MAAGILGITFAGSTGTGRRTPTVGAGRTACLEEPGFAGTDRTVDAPEGGSRNTSKSPLGSLFMVRTLDSADGGRTILMEPVSSWEFTAVFPLSADPGGGKGGAVIISTVLAAILPVGSEPGDTGSESS
ncbi:hypothetical protein FACS1894124_0440 [Spirochaetia bacterium]|nr:hypothetical protein FACS1894124_0440 [Spirochaetia bacterium]